MKILIVASDKGNHFVPFIEEQMAALAQTGVEVERFGIMRKGAWGYLCEVPRLCRTLREVRPDLIHAHYGLSGLVAGLARLLCRISPCSKRRVGDIPVVTTYHGSDINDPAILRLSCLAMRLSAWNIFVSQRNVEIAVKACAVRHYSLIPCGVDLSDDQLLTRTEARSRLAATDMPCTVTDGTNRWQCTFHDIQDAPLILFAGAFDNPVKDAPLAMQAVDCLSQSLSRSSAQDAQPGSVSGTTDSHLLGEADTHLPLLFELRGYSRSEVNLLMCAADCLLLTSRREGSPQVVKEAMACGCPVVSVDVGDVSERLADLDGCYLATSRQPQEIASLLSQALSSHHKTNGRQRLADAGLTNTQVIQRLSAIYQNITH